MAMIQQVNLYKGSLKPSQTKLASNTYLFSLIGMLILLAAYSVFLLLELNNTKSDIEQAKQQLILAESRVQALKTEHPKQEINKLLSQEVSRSQQIFNSFSQVVGLLSDEKSDQTQGFSRYFSALARQSIADVWLTNIAIHAQDHTINLTGSTYQAEKIAVFLQKLHHEPSFQGRSFAKLIISQAEEVENQIDFAINTVDESLEQENHD